MACAIEAHGSDRTVVDPDLIGAMSNVPFVMKRTISRIRANSSV